MKVTEKADVYSFGVVVLELMMGKHPGDLITNLSSSKSEDGNFLLKDLLDERLVPPTAQLAEEIVFVVTLAIACARAKPESRPPMRFVAQELSAPTQAYLSEPLGMITMGKLSNFQK
ncbi:hypothetical protein ACHQM5_005123 [Ranunculus cassubicifolius]